MAIVLTHKEWRERELGELEHDIGATREVLKMVGEQIREREPRLKKHLAEINALPYAERNDEAADRIVEEIQRLGGPMQDTLYNGVFLATWMYVEVNLLRLAMANIERLFRNADKSEEEIKSERKKIGRFEDIKLALGDHGIETGSLKGWSELKELQKVRNLLAHAGGVLYDTDDATLKMLRKHEDKGLGVLNDSFVIVFPVYCEHAVDVVDKVLRAVIDKVTPYSTRTVLRLRGAPLVRPADNVVSNEPPLVPPGLSF